MSKKNAISAVKLNASSLKKFRELLPNVMEQNYALSQLGLSNGEVSKVTKASPTNVSRDKWAFNNGYKQLTVPVSKVKAIFK